MAAATVTLKNHALADVVLDLQGATSRGAIYKDSARALALPRTLEIQFNIGAPGAKGNDKLVLIARDAVQNGTTGLVSVGSARLEVSVPRDSAFTTGKTEDLMAFIWSFITTDNRASLADAIVP